jgi:hypothetical protein
MKRIRLIIGIGVILIVGVLVGLSFLVASRLPLPTDLAREYCAAQGIPAQNLALIRYQSSDRIFANNATVEFQVTGANPARRVVVELNQPVYFLAWQPMDLTDLP